jgi:putative endonuclease
MASYCYILECANGHYYTGWTTDPKRRFKQHLAGNAAAYTRMNPASKLVYLEKLDDTSAALRREAAIKRLNHTQKAALIANLEHNQIADYLEA